MHPLGLFSRDLLIGVAGCDHEDLKICRDDVVVRGAPRSQVAWVQNLQARDGSPPHGASPKLLNL